MVSGRGGCLAIPWRWFCGELVGWILGLQLVAGNFEVGLDSESIERGGTAVLILTFTDFGEVEAPAPPAIPGASVQYLGAQRQSSFSFANGTQTQQLKVQHRYGITPKTEGTLTIPAFAVTVAGQQFASQPMQLTVGKAAETTAFARLQLVIPTNTFYVGQPFVAHLQFLFRQSPAQVGVPQLPTDGFVVGRSVKASSYEQRIGAENWGVYDSPVVLSPARAGELPLGPAEIETVFSVGPRRGGIFGDFFAEQRRFNFKSGSNSVTVMEPPLANRPAGYHGAIGRFSVRVTAKPTTVTVGDPISVRVMVDGAGGFDSLALPEFAADSGFRTYAGTNGLLVRDQFGFIGTKTFELVVVPERSDLTALTLPPLVSFDPDSKTYVVAQAPEIPLTVKPGASAQALPSVTPAYSPAPTNTGGGKDLVHLRPISFDPEHSVRLSPPWTRQTWYWVAVLVPPFGWAGLALGSLIVRRRGADPQKLSRALAERRAQTAWQRLAEANGPAFYEALDLGLREQIGLLTGLPPGGIVADVIDQRLIPLGLPEVEAVRLRRLFEVVASARFAPVGLAQDQHRCRAEVESAVAALRALEGRP